MTLTEKQAELITALRDAIHDEVLFGGGAGGAKSFGGCYWLITNCLNYPGSRWLMGRAKLKTLKETTLNTFFEVAKLMNVQSSLYDYNSQAGTITFFNGSQILLKDLFLYPSDPNFDSLGSLEITGAFIDECNQLVEKAWNIVKSRIRYKLDEFSLIPKILGTCNPSKNWVYQRFYKPNKENELPPNRLFIQSLVDDNPFISKHYRSNLLSLDYISKQRLLFGDWEYDDDPSALIAFDKITDIFTNDHVEPGKKYITADIARYGTDKTVILAWSGFRVISMRVIARNSIPEAAQAITEMKNRYGVGTSSIMIDEDGIGGGVVDLLPGCKGFKANARPYNDENYDNLKSQCYYKLADLINENGIMFVPRDNKVHEMITEELEQVKQKAVDSDNKKGIIPKEKVKELIGRSPDFSDALMMRMYFELKPAYKLKSRLA